MANLKSIKKGDMVTLHMFTGALIGGFKVTKADAKTLGFTNKSGVEMVFDKKTGKQIEPTPKSEKFANFVTEYDEDAIEEAAAKRSSAPRKAKKTSKPVAKPKPEPEDEELEDEEDEFDEDDELDDDEDDDLDDDFEEEEEEEEPEEKPAPKKKPRVVVKKQVKKVAARKKPNEDDFEEID